MNKLSAAYRAFIAWQNSLPTPAKTLLLMIEAAVIGVVWNWLTSPQGLCLSKQCLQVLGGTIGAAVVAAFHNWAKQSPIKPVLTAQVSQPQK